VRSMAVPWLRTQNNPAKARPWPRQTRPVGNWTWLGKDRFQTRTDQRLCQWRRVGYARGSTAVAIYGRSQRIPWGQHGWQIQVGPYRTVARYTTSDDAAICSGHGQCLRPRKLSVCHQWCTDPPRPTSDVLVCPSCLTGSIRLVQAPPSVEASVRSSRKTRYTDSNSVVQENPGGKEFPMSHAEILGGSRDRRCSIPKFGPLKNSVSPFPFDELNRRIARREVGNHQRSSAYAVTWWWISTFPSNIRHMAEDRQGKASTCGRMSKCTRVWKLRDIRSPTAPLGTWPPSPKPNCFGAGIKGVW